MIKAARKRTKGITAGLWDIETVVGTERAKHREDYWRRKYHRDANVKILRVRVK